MILAGKIKGCTLGLERSKYQRFVRNVIACVLGEQVRQKYEGCINEEQLRHASLKFSRFSQIVANKIASIVEYDEELCPNETITVPVHSKGRRFSFSDKKRMPLVKKQIKRLSFSKSQEEETNTKVNGHKTCEHLEKMMKRLSLNKK